MTLELINSSVYYIDILYTICLYKHLVHLSSAGLLSIQLDFTAPSPKALEHLELLLIICTQSCYATVFLCILIVIQINKILKLSYYTFSR